MNLSRPMTYLRTIKMKPRNLLEIPRKSLISWLRPGYIILTILLLTTIGITSNYYARYKLNKIGLKSTEASSDEQIVLKHINQKPNTALMVTYLQKIKFLVLSEIHAPGPSHTIASDEYCKQTPFVITPAIFTWYVRR